jgi:ribosome-binding factor A
MAERRPARVAHLVQSELAGLLLRGAKDPRLQHVTVTSVRMTPDLRVAHVYFRTLGAGDADGSIQRALERAAHYLRGEIGRSLGLRLTPELRFAYDTTPDTAQRLEDLLRGRTPPPDDDEGDA